LSFAFFTLIYPLQRQGFFDLQHESSDIFEREIDLSRDSCFDFLDIRDIDVLIGERECEIDDFKIELSLIDLLLFLLFASLDFLLFLLLLFIIFFN
jgi:hypothetical protein